MWDESNTVRECERCPRSGLEVEETRVDGETYALCRECSRRVTLRGVNRAQ